MHRLWECPANIGYRRELDSHIPGNAFPSGLPSCLARCGLVPFGFQSSTGLDMADLKHIQNYLLIVNAAATLAGVDVKHGREVSFSIRQPLSVPLSHFYKSGAPPLKRPRGSSHPRLAIPILCPPVARPPALSLDELQHLFSSGLFDVAITISSDGSFDSLKDISGWGFTIARASDRSIADVCGPVILELSHPNFLGATKHSNNTAELSGLALAMRWVSDSRLSEVINLEYDSVYAANAIQGLCRITCNAALVVRARTEFRKVAHLIRWRKVAAHSGLFLNERADLLAKCGALGIVCEPSSSAGMSSGTS